MCKSLLIEIEKVRDSESCKKFLTELNYRYREGTLHYEVYHRLNKAYSIILDSFLKKEGKLDD